MTRTTFHFQAAMKMIPFRTQQTSPWLVLALPVLLGTLTATAAPGLSAGLTRGSPGQVLQLPIRLTGTTGDVAIVGAQFDLNFATNSVTILDVIPSGNVLDSGHQLVSHAAGAGIRRIVIWSPDGAPLRTGQIATAQVRVDLCAPNGNSLLKFTNALFASAAPIPAAVASGALRSGTNIVINSDLPKPTLTVVKAPAAVTKTNLNLFTGTARDNRAVARVLARINNGHFFEVQTTNAWTNWTALLELPAGTNVVQFKSVDYCGGESPLVSKTTFRQVLAPISLFPLGNGTILGATNGQLLEVGKGYRLTAKPANNWLFRIWGQDIVSRSNSITFLMQPGLGVLAFFETNRYPAVAGTYNGLFFATNSALTPSNSGLATITVGPAGQLSGKLQFGGTSLPFSGTMFAEGVGTVSVPRTGTPKPAPLTLDLVIDLLHPTRSLSGSVSAPGSWSADLDAVLAGGATNQFGNYTFFIPGAANPLSPTLPAGDGSGTIKVTPQGAATLAGTLGDGTAITLSGTLSRGGEWPFFVPLYGGRGMFMGWVRFGADQPVYNPLGSRMVWIKPAIATEKVYPAGFNLVSNLFQGMIYSTPSANQSGLGWTNGNALLIGGNLPDAGAVANVKVVGPAFQVQSNAVKLTLGLTTASGLVNGSFVNPANNKATPVKAVVVQLPPDLGGPTVYGSFVGTNRSGRVTVLETTPNQEP